jgi:hypothetical protein
VPSIAAAGDRYSRLDVLAEEFREASIVVDRLSAHRDALEEIYYTKQRPKPLEHLASKYAAWAASDKKLRHEIGYARARQLEDAARTRLDEIIECVIEAPAVTLQDFRTKLRVIKWCRAAEEINFPEWETADERVHSPSCEISNGLSTRPRIPFSPATTKRKARPLPGFQSVCASTLNSPPSKKLKWIARICE